MTAREQIRRVFLKAQVATLGVRELQAQLPTLKRPTISKECVHMVKLGMLTSKMVGNWHHGRRYEFTATTAMSGRRVKLRKGAQLATEELVMEVMRVAPGALQQSDMRDSINSLFGVVIPRRSLSAAVEYWESREKITRLPGGSRKYPHYELGRSDRLPWAALDKVLRKIEAKRKDSRRLISQSSPWPDTLLRVARQGSATARAE